MKRIGQVLVAAMLVMLVVFDLPQTSFAAEAESKRINLSPDFDIVIPNYMETKKVEDKNVKNRFYTIIVMQTPKKDSNENYPFFEIVTTDKNADFLSSSVTISNYDGNDNSFYMAGYIFEKFNKGSLNYSPSFSLPYRDNPSFNEKVGDLTVVHKDAVYHVALDVFDKDGKPVFEEDLMLMLVNKDESAGTKSDTALAVPTASKVRVDGQEMSFEAYNIADHNYFKLRDLAAAINGTEKQFAVGWDDEKNVIDLRSGKAYIPGGGELEVSKKPASKDAKPTNSQIYVNGSEVQLTAYTIDGSNYFKLRDIAEVFNFGVTWDENAGMIGIDTKSNYQKER